VYLCKSCIDTSHQISQLLIYIHGTLHHIELKSLKESRIILFPELTVDTAVMCVQQIFVKT
jgi:hypothetical protein